MAWAIVTIYTSKCAQMAPQQLPKTSKFYSRSKKYDIEKTLGGVGTTPLGSPKVKGFPRVSILYGKRTRVPSNNVPNSSHYSMDPPHCALLKILKAHHSNNNQNTRQPYSLITEESRDS